MLASRLCKEAKNTRIRILVRSGSSHASYASGADPIRYLRGWIRNVGEGYSALPPGVSY